VLRAARSYNLIDDSNQGPRSSNSQRVASWWVFPRRPFLATLIAEIFHSLIFDSVERWVWFRAEYRAVNCHRVQLRGFRRLRRAFRMYCSTCQVCVIRWTFVDLNVRSLAAWFRNVGLEQRGMAVGLTVAHPRHVPRTCDLAVGGLLDCRKIEVAMMGLLVNQHFRWFRSRNERFLREGKYVSRAPRYARWPTTLGRSVCAGVLGAQGECDQNPGSWDDPHKRRQTVNELTLYWGFRRITTMSQLESNPEEGAHTPFAFFFQELIIFLRHCHGQTACQAEGQALNGETRVPGV
jgi:hypothetical protein